MVGGRSSAILEASCAVVGCLPLGYNPGRLRNEAWNNVALRKPTVMADVRFGRGDVLVQYSYCVSGTA